MKACKGAADAIKYLKSQNKKIYMLTNNSTKNRQDLIAKLRQFNVDVTFDQVIAFVGYDRLKRRAAPVSAFSAEASSSALQNN